MGTLVESDIDQFIKGHKSKLQDERRHRNVSWLHILLPCFFSIYYSDDNDIKSLTLPLLTSVSVAFFSNIISSFLDYTTLESQSTYIFVYSLNSRWQLSICKYKNIFTKNTCRMCLCKYKYLLLLLLFM